MIITIAASALAIQLSMMPQPATGSAIRTVICCRRISPRDSININGPIAAAVILSPAATAPTSIFGTGYATRTERCRCSSSKDVSAITAATDITNVVRNADTIIRNES